VRSLRQNCSGALLNGVRRLHPGVGWGVAFGRLIDWDSGNVRHMLHAAYLTAGNYGLMVNAV